MKYTTVILLLLTTTITFGQKLKKVTQKINKEYSETYYVLKSDKTTKHGEYIKKSKDKGIVEKGYYKNGVKDSLWVYYRNGANQILKSQGHFLNNEKQGEWNFYDWDGKLIQTYDYAKDTILFEKNLTNKYEYTCNTKKDSTENCLYPVLIGGYILMQEILAKNIMYPPLAVEMGIQGAVYISFEINENGKGKNPMLHKGVDPDLDAEALRVVKIILDEVKWYTWGKKTTYKMTIPIKFKLQ